jgi:hypothetical protein
VVLIHSRALPLSPKPTTNEAGHSCRPTFWVCLDPTLSSPFYVLFLGSLCSASARILTTTSPHHPHPYSMLSHASLLPRRPLPTGATIIQGSRTAAATKARYVDCACVCVCVEVILVLRRPDCVILLPNHLPSPYSDEAGRVRRPTVLLCKKPGPLPACFICPSVLWWMLSRGGQ